MRREPTSRSLPSIIFYTHPCYVFLFQKREASVKGGHDGDEDCHRGMGCPGASDRGNLFVCCSKTLFELKDFLYFIFKSLVHSCVVVSHGP